MANPEDFDIDSFLADTRPGKSDADVVSSLTGGEKPTASSAPRKARRKATADSFDIDAFLAKDEKKAEPQSTAEPPNPLVMDPQTKRLVPQRRTYATFTDMPGQKFTAEQLGNIKPDTRMSGPTALAGGALQGATGYFGDELAAGIGALRGQGEYAKLRDENRRANEDAKAGSPTDYAIGEIGGGAFSPLNKLMPGSGGKPLLTLANTGKAAGAGALTGLGASNADLTKGEVGKAMLDTAIGAGSAAAGNTVLGGLGAGGRYVKSAPERVAKKADDILIDKLSLGATAAERDGMVGELGKDVPKVLNYVRSTPELKDAVLSGNYGRAVEILKEQKAAGAKLKDSTIKTLEDRWGKQEAQPVVDGLEKLRAKYAANPAPESQKIAAEFQKRIDTIKERWIPEPPKPEPKGKELLATLSEGANASEKQRIGDNSDLYESVIKKHKLGPSANDPETRYTAIDGAVNELGKRKEALYDKVKDDVLITDVTIPLVKWRDELAKSSEGLKAVPAVDAMIERIWKSRGQGGKRLSMSVKELREEVSDMQKAGFSGPYFDPSVAQDLQRQAAGVMKGALDKHIESIGGGKVASQIADLNKEYSVLLTLRDVAERQRASARLVPPAAPDTRTGQASVGEMFDLANTTENPEAKAAIMSGLTKQMDKGAAADLAKVNADEKLISQIEAPLAHLATRNSTPATTLRARATEAAGRLGEAGIAGAITAGALGHAGLGSIVAAMSLGLKYGPQIGAKAEPAMAQMVTAMRAGAKRAHLEKIGKLNKLPKYVIDDMVGTLLPRTAAGEVVGRIKREPEESSGQGTPVVPPSGQTLAREGAR